ncbi:MAG: ABC transporter transmembrane domain-containing protein, partial [Pseudomonadota bacterium]
MATLPLIDTNSVLMRLLSEAGARHWKGYALALALMGISAAMTGLAAWIMRDVINELFVDRNEQAIQAIALAVAVIFVAKGATTYGAQLVLRRIGNAIVADIQHRLFDRILAERIDFFDSFNIGDLATRLSHNAQAARNAMSTMITGLGRDGLTLVALVIVMIAQNPRMSLIAITMAPPAIWGVTILIRRVKKIARAQFVSLTKIVSTVQETALGVRVVKAFGLEDRMRARMDRA